MAQKNYAGLLFSKIAGSKAENEAGSDNRFKLHLTFLVVMNTI